MISWFRKHRAWNTYNIHIEIKNKDTDTVDAVVKVQVEARSSRQALKWAKNNYVMNVGKSFKNK